jgi:hypothetical protein
MFIFVKIIEKLDKTVKRKILSDQYWNCIYNSYSSFSITSNGRNNVVKKD